MEGTMKEMERMIVRLLNEQQERIAKNSGIPLETIKRYASEGVGVVCVEEVSDKKGRAMEATQYRFASVDVVSQSPSSGVDVAPPVPKKARAPAKPKVDENGEPIVVEKKARAPAKPKVDENGEPIVVEKKARAPPKPKAIASVEGVEGGDAPLKKARAPAKPKVDENGEPIVKVAKARAQAKPKAIASVEGVEKAKATKVVVDFGSDSEDEDGKTVIMEEDTDEEKAADALYREVNKEAIANHEAYVEMTKEVDVVRVTIEGQEFLVDGNNCVYQEESQMLVGMYDEASNSIRALTEEEEEEYGSDGDECPVLSDEE